MSSFSIAISDIRGTTSGAKTPSIPETMQGVTCNAHIILGDDAVQGRLPLIVFFIEMILPALEISLLGKNQAILRFDSTPVADIRPDGECYLINYYKGKNSVDLHIDRVIFHEELVKLSKGIKEQFADLPSLPVEGSLLRSDRSFEATILRSLLGSG